MKEREKKQSLNFFIYHSGDFRKEKNWRLASFEI